MRLSCYSHRTVRLQTNTAKERESGNGSQDTDKGTLYNFQKEIETKRRELSYFKNWPRKGRIKEKESLMLMTAVRSMDHLGHILTQSLSDDDDIDQASYF